MHAPERGAALLDATYGPDWDEKIDLESLDLASTCNCILGQLERAEGGSRRGSPFGRQLKKLGVSAEASEHGFDTTRAYGHYGFKDYGRLTTAWRRLIRNRRKARA